MHRSRGQRGDAGSRPSGNSLKDVKKALSAIKLCSYYFSSIVSNDINVTGIL